MAEQLAWEKTRRADTTFSSSFQRASTAIGPFAMLASTLLSSLIAASATVQAAPFFASRPPPKALAKRAEPKTWQSHVSDVQIHESCNASQSAYLRNGLDDMKRIAEHAHDRILTLGEQDPLYVSALPTPSSRLCLVTLH